MLLVETNAGVTRITLNRPDRRNALSEAMLTELGNQFEKISTDKATRVIVLAAAGPVFCSGHDLGEMTNRSESDYRALFTRCSSVMQMLRRLPQPVIARVQGMATAAGCQLVAACDMAIASTDAKFATPGVKIGLFCSTPMVPLVRAVPTKVAMEMLLTGTPISAQRALEVGLVNRIVPADQLDATLKEWTDAIVSSSPMTIGLGKRAFYDQLDLDEPAAYEQVTCVMTQNALKRDAQEGISAFLQKRPPRWTGE